MESNRAIPRKPVDIARVALRKMAELGLPPTPENFAEQYRRAGGLPPVDVSAAGDSLRGLEMESMLRGIVDMITQTATGLSGGLDRFGGEVKGMLSKVDHADSGEGLRALMQALTVSALALQEAVDDSRTELAQTQEKLAKVSTELERTHEQARTDPLTGFVNRRGMDEVLVREVARCKRTSGPLSVAIMDIDHFKRVNDEHGHDAGDQALVHLARVARTGVRETDIVCRYGGEEFVVVSTRCGGRRCAFRGRPHAFAGGEDPVRAGAAQAGDPVQRGRGGVREGRDARRSVETGRPRALSGEAGRAQPGRDRASIRRSGSLPLDHRPPTVARHDFDGDLGIVLDDDCALRAPRARHGRIGPSRGARTLPTRRSRHPT